MLINNAGVVDTTTLLEQEPRAWDRVLDTNLRGAYLVTRAVGRHLVAQQAGKIINVASNVTLMGVPHEASYSASKGALVAFTRSLAVEWAPHNIQVSAIAPGHFATSLNEELRGCKQRLQAVLGRIPARRMGQPAELGPWVLLQASEASDFMTGETIVIDGGESIH